MTTATRAVTILVVGAACGVALPALAHTYGAAGAGVGQGLVHPFLGLDHVLALVAVGLWSAQLGGAALWRIPGAFLTAMAVGAIAAAAGVAVPGVELGIAASVALFGLLVALGARPGSAWGIGLVGLFALLHGHAHGSELPATAAPLAYGLGLAAASLLLLYAGVGSGLVARRAPWPGARGLVRACGAGVATVGAAFVLAA